MGDFIIGIVNGGISDLAIVLTWILNLLPPSPFALIDSSPIGQYLPYINWIIPVQLIVNSISLWLSSIAIYYLCAIVMRWIKVIGD